MISFKGRHFKKTVILVSVRWYVAYSLSYRNIEEMLKERGISVDHAIINRWVIRYVPLLEKEFRKKHKRGALKSEKNRHCEELATKQSRKNLFKNNWIASQRSSSQ